VFTTAPSARSANTTPQLGKELVQLWHACGVAHPALVTLDHLEIVGETFDARAAREVFEYEPGWGLPSSEDRVALAALMQNSEE